MKSPFALLCLILALSVAGCSTIPTEPRQTKHVRTRGRLCDLYVELDGEWTKFCSDIGDYCLCQSPDGRYLLLTDFRGCYKVNIKVYDTETRELFDITQSIHGRLPSLSERPLFIAKRFINNKVAEFRMDFLPKTREEKPVVEALKKAPFEIDIEYLLEGIRYR